MAPMNKILVAVDGSAPSMLAARLGFQLAQATGARLTAAYAVVLIVMAGEIPFTVVTDIMDAELARGKEVLQEEVEDLGSPDVLTVPLEGPVAERLAELAEHEAFDLVVVGSRGRNAVTRMLLGSVLTWDVEALCRCRVAPPRTGVANRGVSHPIWRTPCSVLGPPSPCERRTT